MNFCPAEGADIKRSAVQAFPKPEHRFEIVGSGTQFAIVPSPEAVENRARQPDSRSGLVSQQTPLLKQQQMTDRRPPMRLVMVLTDASLTGKRRPRPVPVAQRGIKRQSAPIVVMVAVPSENDDFGTGIVCFTERHPA